MVGTVDLSYKHALVEILSSSQTQAITVTHTPMTRAIPQTESYLCQTIAIVSGIGSYAAQLTQSLDRSWGLGASQWMVTFITSFICRNSVKKRARSIHRWYSQRYHIGLARIGQHNAQFGQSFQAAAARQDFVLMWAVLQYHTIPTKTPQIHVSRPAFSRFDLHDCQTQMTCRHKFAGLHARCSDEYAAQLPQCLSKSRCAGDAAQLWIYPRIIWNIATLSHGQR